MIGLLAPVIAPTVSVVPRFTMRFVPVAGINTQTMGSDVPGANSTINVADARKDGAAIGTYFFRGINSYPTSAFYIFDWRTLAIKPPEPNFPKFLPFAIVGERRVVGSDDEVRTWDSDPLVAARVVAGGLEIGRPLRSGSKESRIEPRPRLDGDLPLPDGKGVTAMRLDRSLFPARYLRRSDLQGIAPAAIRRFRIGADEAIGDASFQNPGEDGVVFFNIESVGLYWRGDEARPLASVVKGAEGFEFDQMGWASPEGWFIFGAAKGSVSGLAWVFPVKKGPVRKG